MSKSGDKAMTGIRPAYEDKAPVANKVTFFPFQEGRERTILLDVFIGDDGREKDFIILDFVEKLDGMEGSELGKLKTLAKEPEFRNVTAMGLQLDSAEDRDWLDKNMTTMGWIDAFRAMMDYRMAGSVWRPDVQAALGK